MAEFSHAGNFQKFHFDGAKIRLGRRCPGVARELLRPPATALQTATARHRTKKLNTQRMGASMKSRIHVFILFQWFVFAIL